MNKYILLFHICCDKSLSQCNFLVVKKCRCRILRVIISQKVSYQKIRSIYYLNSNKFPICNDFICYKLKQNSCIDQSCLYNLCCIDLFKRIELIFQNFIEIVFILVTLCSNYMIYVSTLDTTISQMCVLVHSFQILAALWWY